MRQIQIKYDEAKIQCGLFNYLINRGREYILPNLYYAWSNGESDLITVTRAGYVYEYEIKISHADFLADFKKRKHRYFKQGDGHGLSRFYYVAPIKAIPLCVPEYAGLIEATYGAHGSILFNEIRPARRLNGRKISNYDLKRMTRSLMWKYWNLAHLLNTNKIQRELWK